MGIALRNLTTVLQGSSMNAGKSKLSKAKPNTQTENQIQSAIREYLHWKGWFVIRHQQGLGCHKGLSDLTAIKDGHVVWIEVKTPRGSQSDCQKEFEAKVIDHGGQYLLARSVDDVMDLR